MQNDYWFTTTTFVDEFKSFTIEIQDGERY